jgi:hypothetical protein
LDAGQGRDGRWTGCVPDGQRVFEGHVNKPVSKKQSDLTVYFVFANVVALTGQTRYKCAELPAVNTALFKGEHDETLFFRWSQSPSGQNVYGGTRH